MIGAARPVSLHRRALIAAAAATILAPRRSFASEIVKIRDLWGDGGRFSPLATRLAGQLVKLRGYMAPPLKAEASFFVLTRIPMAVCPFCDSEASWPDDLVVAEARKAFIPTSFNDLIAVKGRLEIGGKIDPGTGFASRVRVADAVWSRV